MALNNRKYANLPDLDSAPDIYETPDLTDDNSTLPTGTARSQSATSVYSDFDDGDNGEPAISRDRLQPDSARTRFQQSRVDAKEVDFSDRVDSKRKSYKVSTRRQFTEDGEPVELGDFSDEEDAEGLDRKLARLRREIEEVKEAFAKRKAENKESVESDDGDTTELSKMLETLSHAEGKPETSAGSKLAKALSSTPRPNDSKAPAAAEQKPGDSTTYTVTYAPDFQDSHTLAKAARFDDRLTMLEQVLGLNSSAIPELDAKGVPRAILPTLDTLQRQMLVLSETSASSLEGISRRVRSLTSEAERLEESRRSAKAAQDDLKAAGGYMTPTGDSEDSEQIAKINALYGTLPAIEKLAPLLPAVLDRLRSLRLIHADAATVHETLEKVERRQEDMTNDIKMWEEGLTKVEEAMRQGESTMGGNMKTVEGWVKDLEGKMSKFA